MPKRSKPSTPLSPLPLKTKPRKAETTPARPATRSVPGTPNPAPQKTPRTSARSSAKPLLPAASKREPQGAPIHVPVYIFRTVDYLYADAPELSEDSKQRRGALRAHEGKQAVLRHVAEHYVVPRDFDTNTQRFGAHSGLLHEDRLISAYESGLLPRRDAGAQSPPRLCYRCLGAHMSADCPSLCA